jgi:hypothetical protein
VTVREWLATRTPAAPAALMERMLAILGTRGDAPVDRAAETLLDAAQAELRRLLEERHFARDGALDLLAVDGLMTFAYEHGAERAGSSADLDALTRRGVAAVAPLAAHG